MANRHIDLTINSTPLCDIFDTTLAFATAAEFPEIGEGGYKYGATDTGYLYRWYNGEYVNVASMTAQQIVDYSIQNQMYPTEVSLVSETYSRDSERTANYELVNLTLVNRKAKPEFTWEIIRAAYVENLLAFLDYKYDFASVVEGETIITPKEAEIISVGYYDMIGLRTINAYLGQTINGTLCSINEVLYWKEFRIAFPER